MTLLEKVQELQAVNPPLDGSEINRRLQEWKGSGFLLDDQMKIKSNPLVENVEDNLAKLNDSADVVPVVGSNENLELQSAPGLLDSLESLKFDLDNPKDNITQVEAETNETAVDAIATQPVTDIDLPINEDFKCNPSTVYGISKLMQTKYALNWSENGGYIKIVRPFSILGIGMPRYLAMGNFTAQIKEFVLSKSKSYTLETGNIEISRDFVDVNDVVEICWKLINYDEGNGRIVNICSGKPLKFKMLIEYMLELVDMDIVLQEDSRLLRSNDMLTHYGDNNLLLKLTDDYEFTTWQKSLENIMNTK